MSRWLILLLALPLVAQRVKLTRKVHPVQQAVRRQIEGNLVRLQRYTLTWQIEIGQVTDDGMVRDPAYVQVSWEMRGKKPCLFGVRYSDEPPGFALSTGCLKSSTSGEVPFEAARLVLRRPASSIEPVTLPDGGLGYAMTFLPEDLGRKAIPEELCRNSATVRVLTDALTSRLVESEARVIAPGCAVKGAGTQPLLAPGSVMVTRYLTDGEVNVPMETDEVLVRFESSGGPQIWFGRRLPYDPDDPDAMALVSIRLLTYERRSVLRINPEE